MGEFAVVLGDKDWYFDISLYLHVRGIWIQYWIELFFSAMALIFGTIYSTNLYILRQLLIFGSVELLHISIQTVVFGL